MQRIPQQQQHQNKQPPTTRRKSQKRNKTRHFHHFQQRHGKSTQLRHPHSTEKDEHMHMVGWKTKVCGIFTQNDSFEEQTKIFKLNFSKMMEAMKDSDISVKLIQLVQGKGEISPQALFKLNPQDQQGYVKIKEGAKRQPIYRCIRQCEVNKGCVMQP